MVARSAEPETGPSLPVNCPTLARDHARTAVIWVRYGLNPDAKPLQVKRRVSKKCTPR